MVAPTPRNTRHKKAIAMNLTQVDFPSKEKTANGEALTKMIDMLSCLCHEAEKAELDLISLHLNIAFAELTEHHIKSQQKLN